VVSRTGGTGISRRILGPGAAPHRMMACRPFGSHSTAKMAGDEEVSPKLMSVDVATMDDNNNWASPGDLRAVLATPHKQCETRTN
jgi:hypothetical protein